ncbi:unnamed protein product [Penicillium salamii]|uniref:CENP-V/GFA domain-containing protein n=1 Tax=Penicillium salamii TaxID=1612424 RepID=A0A9W4NM91_9EURO|nr:unnamed protein product [Penicillium salamii]CAG8102413.1 unnamed protein product [Penicillium salamii]CAG8376201.1 unnamed protein product [Penicillium salamii]CAG8377878.1 unnamed protein product [Penicillium salamii]CAG8379528.1 unnamed protein product [Penicillium salamii]
MAAGGCFCGKVRIQLNGQPLTTGLCYCDDCRKLTGAPFTYNLLVKTTDMEISGNPKEVAKAADSGNDIRNYFCPDCGTPLYGVKIKDGEPDGIIVLRSGIMDDPRLLRRKPDAEIFTDRRPPWLAPVEGAAQFSGMLPLND